MDAKPKETHPQPGTRFGQWMAAVLDQHIEAGKALETEAIHDLRVALRRSLAMAEAFVDLDPDPAWRDMRRQGRQLFKPLGRLRDVHVLKERVKRIDPAEGPLARAVLDRLEESEREEQRAVRKALARFSRRRWKLWAGHLASRAARMPLDGAAAEYLAVEQWERAYALHRKAARSGSLAAFHRARIGLKKFRYSVENFLPEKGADWIGTLKAMQDALGEVHDLDLLRRMAVSRTIAAGAEERRKWKRQIAALTSERIRAYRAKMSGQGSQWLAWRKALPQESELASAALAWLEVWASHLTPDPAHARHVAKLSLELYDQIAAAGLGGAQPGERMRRVLEIAALAHDVGRARGARSHHKRSYRMISALKTPLGWSPEEIQLAALVARYHRRALPQLNQAAFARLRPDRRQKVVLLAGILRLANAFDQQHDASVRSLRARVARDSIEIRAGGYTGAEPGASRIASARHLFEIACKRPVAVLPGA